MIQLKKITYENFYDVIHLKVSPSQKGFVAPNLFSLAEAYVTSSNDLCIPIPFAVYNKKTLVGFVMLSYEKNENIYTIWRFMIDKKHQNKGYGKALLKETVSYIKTFPMGPASAIKLSYEPENIVAKSLYASFGFIETGEVDGNEIVAKLDL